MQPTVIHGMSNADYHARPEISKSGLDLIHKAPAVYRYRRDNPEPSTPAQRWGTLVHTAILEPETLSERVAVAPAVDRRTKDGKAVWEAFQAEAGGREVITAEESFALESVRAMTWAHPAAGKALAMLRQVETSIFWADETTGVLCRCRPDGILINGTILDVKTTTDASPDAFASSIAKWRYHVQAAFYSDGYRAAFGDDPKAFVFLAIEKTPPYLCAIYVMDEKAVIRGRSEYAANLETYAQCVATDTWPALSADPVVLDLPRWY